MKQKTTYQSISPVKNGSYKLNVIDQLQMILQPPIPHSLQSKHAVNSTCLDTREPQGAYSIKDFCQSFGGITRQHFHALVKRGHAPQTFKVGRRTLISRHAAAEWASRLESNSDTTMQAAA